MSEASAIAIGGGLAGAAFAIELARRGHPVVVLERTAGAHHKVCGEFLSAEAQSLLAQLGLDVWLLGARPAKHLGLEFGTRIDGIPLPFCGAGLSRFRLDQRLLDAAARAGAEVIRGVTVTRLDYDRDRVVVHAGNRQWTAPHVALATGKHNLRGLARPPTSNVALKMQLDLDAAAVGLLRDTVQLAIFPGGYGGACLAEDGIAPICWVLEQDSLDTASPDWPTHAAFLAQRSGFFAKLLRGATPRFERPVAVAGIPYGFLRRQVISDAVYPVGDQLMVIPSYTGDGTSIALHSGIAAAQAVLNKRTGSEFQKAMMAKLKPQMAWSKLANVAFANATAQRLASAAARAMPWAVPPMARLIVNMTRLRV